MLPRTSIIAMIAAYVEGVRVLEQTLYIARLADYDSSFSYKCLLTEGRSDVMSVSQLALQMVIVVLNVLLSAIVLFAENIYLLLQRQ